MEGSWCGAAVGACTAMRMHEKVAVPHVGAAGGMGSRANGTRLNSQMVQQGQTAAHDGLEVVQLPVETGDLLVVGGVPQGRASSLHTK